MYIESFKNKTQKYREFLFQQLEDILTALNLCDTDIKGIKSLVINKVKNKENEEKASILQRSQNIACVCFFFS